MVLVLLISLFTSQAFCANNTITKEPLKEIDPKVDYVLQSCLQKNNLNACLQSETKKMNEKNYKDAYAAKKKACDLNDDYCGNLYVIAKLNGPSVVSELQTVFIERCLKTAKLCDEVAIMYEDQKDYANAINYARKYYLKFQTGSFAGLVYKYGDKDEAYMASFTDCNQNSAKCALYLNMMPTHPQIAKMLPKAEEQCHNAKIRSLGSPCQSLGGYYYKKDNIQKAYESWWEDCLKDNATSCLLAGAFFKKIEKDKTHKAYEQFCKIKKTLTPEQLDLQKYCVIINKSIDIPIDVKQAAEKELKNYAEEKSN